MPSTEDLSVIFSEEAWPYLPRVFPKQSTLLSYTFSKDVSAETRRILSNFEVSTTPQANLLYLCSLVHTMHPSLKVEQLNVQEKFKNDHLAFVSYIHRIINICVKKPAFDRLYVFPLQDLCENSKGLILALIHSQQVRMSITNNAVVSLGRSGIRIFQPNPKASYYMSKDAVFRVYSITPSSSSPSYSSPSSDAEDSAAPQEEENTASAPPAAITMKPLSLEMAPEEMECTCCMDSFPDLFMAATKNATNPAAALKKKKMNKKKKTPSAATHSNHSNQQQLAAAAAAATKGFFRCCNCSSVYCSQCIKNHNTTNPDLFRCFICKTAMRMVKNDTVVTYLADIENNLEACAFLCAKKWFDIDIVHHMPEDSFRVRFAVLYDILTDEQFSQIVRIFNFATGTYQTEENFYVCY